MQLSIIIVNYKSSGFICDCLASADKELLANNQIEWIIVDNDSQDESKAVICNQFPFVQWVEMGYNAGFARANNEGMRRANGAAVLLLNPDTLLINGAIESCLNRLLNSSHVACGVQLVHRDMSPQFSGSNFMKGGLNHLLPLPYWGSILKKVAGVFKTTTPSVLQAQPEQIIDWVSGAFLMVKKAVIAKAGLMDEDFFLYGEEVEWCSRLRKHGTICVYGDIQIIHLIGATIQEATNAEDNSYENLYDKKGFQLMVSNHLRIRKQYGVGWFLFQLLNYTWTVPFAMACSVLENAFKLQSPFAALNQYWAFGKNVMGVWKLTPTIIAGKPHFYKCI
jgi:GT2 family glycosyltransferase